KIGPKVVLPLDKLKYGASKRQKRHSKLTRRASTRQNGKPKQFRGGFFAIGGPASRIAGAPAAFPAPPGSSGVSRARFTSLKEALERSGEVTRRAPAPKTTPVSPIGASQTATASGGGAVAPPLPAVLLPYRCCWRARILPTCSSAPGPAAASRVARARGERTIASRRWSPSTHRES